MTTIQDEARPTRRFGTRGILDVLEGERTPAEPGPGALTPETLRALDLAIGRRVAGILAGDYRSAFAGIGTELHQVGPTNPATTCAGSTGTSPRAQARHTSASSSPNEPS